MRMYLTSLLGDVRLEEVEELWADFTNKLEELKAGYMADYDIPKDKIRREETIGEKNTKKKKRDAPQFIAGSVTWSSFIIPQPVPTAHQEEPNVFVSPPLRMHPRPLPER